MTYYTPRPADANLGSAIDFGRLNQLGLAVKNGASASEKDQKQVAQQFEAMFIQQLLKQARQASGMKGLLDSDQTRLVQSMSDEQSALQLSDPGIGLAQALLQQIQGNSSSGQGAAAIEARAKSLPELASSRVPGLRSRIGEERKEDATSISSLIDMLSQSPMGSMVGAAVSAVQGAPAHIQNFVDRMGSAAKVAAAKSGLPAELILSQAALESGWGKREIRGDDGANSYNLFGIKATGGWTGKVVNITTTEYENGVARKVVQPFRVYNSYAESFADYAKLIGNSDRYSDVAKASSAQEAARRIQDAGYATDPAYAEKLINIMGYFNKLAT